MSTSAPDVLGPTRYARRGSVHLAFRTTSDEGYPILLLPGTFLPIDSFSTWPDLDAFISVLAGWGRVIVTDRRGIGHSDPPEELSDLTLEAYAADVLAVLDQAVADVPVAVVAGFDAVPPALALAAHHADRIASLTLISGFAKFVRSDDHPMGVNPAMLGPTPAEVLDGSAPTLEAPDMSVLLAPTLAADDRFRAWFAEAGRRGASPSSALRMFQAMSRWDARPVLPDVAAETLVLHRDEDRFLNPRQSSFIASHVPRSRLVLLPGDDVLMWSGDAEAVLATIESHVTGQAAGRATRRLAAILFSDLVSSTSLAGSMGDSQWTALLDQHDEAVSRVVRARGGRVVKWTGDGVLAVFDSASLALEAAEHLHDAVRTVGLHARVAVHVGELERRGDDISGIAVHAASRLLGVADADETIVSTSVTAAVAGSEHAFQPIGQVSLKGFAQPWDVHRLNSKRH